MNDLKPYIAKLAENQVLGFNEAKDAFSVIMSGQATPAQIGGFLMALRLRGESIDEISGAVAAMRAKMLPVEIEALIGEVAHGEMLDIVGTGGDGTGSYNVSTATALVVAGCGVRVAKHGNRALSSRSGAADALRNLGVNIDATPDLIVRCLTQAGIGFMFAPTHHPAMRHVGPARIELGVRTIFNLLGPLCNPAGVKRQLIGVFSPQWLESVAQSLIKLGSDAFWVVHGGGMDEITTAGETQVVAYAQGKLTKMTITPEDGGLARARMQDLKGGDEQTNARALTQVLAGQPGAYRDIVLLNAAASLIIAGKAGDLKQGVEMARHSIDSGRAAATLAKLVEISNSKDLNNE